jgi:hypothetical protein
MLTRPAAHCGPLAAAHLPAPSPAHLIHPPTYPPTQVIGVDVGHSQVAPALAADPRLVVMERTNVRTLTLDQHLGGQQVRLGGLAEARGRKGGGGGVNTRWHRGLGVGAEGTAGGVCG